MITGGLKDPGVRRLYLNITKDETTIQFWTTFAADVFLKLTSEQVSAENVEELRAFLLKLADETREVEGRVEDVTDEVMASAGLGLLVNYLVVLLFSVILFASSVFALEQPARREIMGSGPDPFGIAAYLGNTIYAVASWMSSIPLWRREDDMSLIDSNVERPMGPTQMPTSLVLFQPDTGRYVRSFGQSLIRSISNLSPSSPVPAAPLAIGAVADEILTCAAGMNEGINATIPAGSMANASQYVATSSVAVAAALAENLVPSTTTIAIGAGALLGSALLIGAYKKRPNLLRRGRKIKADFTLFTQRLTGSYFTNFEENVERIKLKFERAISDIEKKRAQIRRNQDEMEDRQEETLRSLNNAGLEMAEVIERAKEFRGVLITVNGTLDETVEILTRLNLLTVNDTFIEDEGAILENATAKLENISKERLAADSEKINSDTDTLMTEINLARFVSRANLTEIDALERARENIDRRLLGLKDKFKSYNTLWLTAQIIAPPETNSITNSIVRISQAAVQEDFKSALLYIDNFAREDRVEDINDNSRDTNVQQFPPIDLSALDFYEYYSAIVRKIDQLTERIENEKNVNGSIGRIGRRLNVILSDHQLRTQNVREIRRGLKVRIVNHQRAIEESLAEIETLIGSSGAITTRLDERLRRESVNFFSEEIEDLRNLFYQKNREFAQIERLIALARDQVVRASQNIRLRASAVKFRQDLKNRNESKLNAISGDLEENSTIFRSILEEKQRIRNDASDWRFIEVPKDAGTLEEKLETLEKILDGIRIDEEPPLVDIPLALVDEEDRFAEIVRSFDETYAALEQLIEFRKRNKADRLARERTQHEEFIRRIRRGEGFGEPTEDAARSRAKQEEEEAALRKEQENRKLVEELQELRKDPLMFRVYHSWKTKYLNCVHGHRFLEFDNVGGWQCFQHALPYDTTERVWPCCDNSFEHLGCVRADHRTRDTPYTDEQTITTLHRVIVKRLGANRHGFSAPSSYVRYDRDERQRRIREASMRAQSRQKFQIVNRSRDTDTVDILMPRLLRFDLNSNGEIIIEDKEDIWLWNWDPKNRPYIITFPTLSNTFAYVFEKTERTIWIKVAELVRDVELLFKGGRYGVYYHRHPRSPIEFTPIERVARWEESSA